MLKITEIDIKIAELEEKQRKVNRKRVHDGPMDRGLNHEKNFI